MRGAVANALSRDGVVLAVWCPELPNPDQTGGPRNDVAANNLPFNRSWCVLPFIHRSLVEQLINPLATAVVEALEALAASTAQVCAMSQAQVLAALQEVIESIAEFSVTSSGDHANVLEIYDFASI